MNDAAPITWLIDRINTLMSSGLVTGAQAISDTITPLVAACFGIYIILIATNYMRGAEQEPVMDFIFRMMSFSVVIGLGLNASAYASHVIPIVTGIGPNLADAITGGSVTAGTLDQLALHYLNIIDKGFDGIALLTSPGAYVLMLFKSLLIIFGLAPFLIVATVMTIVANAGSIIVAMVGPIYFAFLLFPATRQYFNAWLNTALSYALIPVFVAVIATVSVGLSVEMLSNGGSLNETSLADVFLAALGNLILVFLLKQVSSIASALSSGGINAGMPGTVGSVARTLGSHQSQRAMRQMGQGALSVGKGAFAAVNPFAYQRTYNKIAGKFNSIRKAG